MNCGACWIKPTASVIWQYEGDLDVDEALVLALIRVAKNVADRVQALGRSNVNPIPA